MIYLACFAVSVLFAYYANKAQKKKLFWLFSVLSILVTVLLACLRDYSIGTDTKNYLTLERFWASAIRKESLLAYLDYYRRLGFHEFLFAFFVGVVARLTGEYRVFLFLTHAVIVTGVYIGAFRMKHRARPEMVLLLFYLMFYNSSLNVMRQYMAMAIVFAFFADLEQRKFIRYAVVVVIASFIHATALLALALPVVYLLLYPKKDSYTVSSKWLLGLCIAIVVGIVLFIPAVKLGIQIDLISTKYNFFLQGKVSPIAKTRVALRIMEVVGLCLSFKELKKQNASAEFYVVNTVIYIGFLFLAPFITYGHRVPVHFAFPNLITISMLPNCQKNKKVRLCWMIGTVLLLTYYWYHTYALGGADETIPYKFGV